jgi:hypothetical protein
LIERANKPEQGGDLMRFQVALVAAAAAFLAGQPIRSEAVELNVTHFGTGMYGVPYAVAKEKGYFKEAGLDVTGFLTSAGGGTTVRNVLASELPYGDVALPAVIAAAQQDHCARRRRECRRPGLGGPQGRYADQDGPGLQGQETRLFEPEVGHRHDHFNDA